MSAKMADYTSGYDSKLDRRMASLRYLLARDPVLWRFFDGEPMLEGIDR